MNMTPEQIKAFVDTMDPNEIRQHAERFVFIAANCIRQENDNYALWVPLVYNNMPAETLDYLLGKMGMNPTVEAILEHGRWFGRTRLDGCRRRLAPGQWWRRCGDTDMGQCAPVLCTECGGDLILEEKEQ